MSLLEISGSDAKFRERLPQRRDFDAVASGAAILLLALPRLEFGKHAMASFILMSICDAQLSPSALRKDDRKCLEGDVEFGFENSSVYSAFYFVCCSVIVPFE